MRAGAAVVAALALVLSAAGCGGGDGSAEARERVETYIRQVNSVQQQHSAGMRSANDAIRRFAAHRTPTERDAERLRRAATTMLDLRTGLELLQVPPVAAILHRRLLRLFALRHGLAWELRLLAIYLPAAERASAAGERATVVLRRRLGSAATVDEQIAALRDYGARMRSARLRVGALAPPPVLKPWNGAQVGRLRSSEALAAGLSTALARGDQEGADRALARFRSAGAARRGLENAQAAAVRSFNARIRAGERLVAQIERERVRLQVDFG